MATALPDSKFMSTASGVTYVQGESATLIRSGHRPVASRTGHRLKHRTTPASLLVPRITLTVTGYRRTLITGSGNRHGVCNSFIDAV